MAKTLETSISLKINAAYTETLDLASRLCPLSKEYLIQLSSGTGANQSDIIWHDQRTLSTGAGEDLDLVATLADAFGATLTFARVKAVIIKAADANTTVLTVTRVATSGTSIFLADGDGLTLRPGGIFMVTNPDATGYVVTATTDDTITITNASGASATYDIIIIGASA